MAMRANLLDRAIGVFAPRLALKRATARAAFEAFSGAGSNEARTAVRMRWISPRGRLPKASSFAPVAGTARQPLARIPA